MTKKHKRHEAEALVRVALLDSELVQYTDNHLASVLGVSKTAVNRCRQLMTDFGEIEFVAKRLRSDGFWMDVTGIGPCYKALRARVREALLRPENEQMGDNVLAAELAVAGTTVRHYRKELIEEGSLPDHTELMGLDAEMYTVRWHEEPVPCEDKMEPANS